MRSNKALVTHLAEICNAVEGSAPFDEGARLASLASFNLDADSEKDLDEIVSLAARLCNTPIATITFVDEHRQWFKARVGLLIHETPRGIAFCAHTVQSTDPMVVTDALLDPRFATNPLVLGAPHIRFYAGFPLVTTSGLSIGTLAVMDTCPRVLEDAAYEACRVLAKQVVKWLQLRLSVTEHEYVSAQLRQARDALSAEVESKSRELHETASAHETSRRLYQALWETTTDTVLVLNQHSVIRFASPSSLELFQYSPEELIGKELGLLQPERLRQAHRAGMQRYMETGQRSANWRATQTIALRKDGVEAPIEISFSQIGVEGKAYFVGFCRDISERKQAEQLLFEEKERANATLRSIGDGVIVINDAGIVTFLNAMAETLTGWASADATGQRHDTVFRLVTPQGAQAPIYEELSHLPEAAFPLVGQSVSLVRRDGESLLIEGMMTRLRDRNGQPFGSVIAFRDVSKWRQITAMLSHQASHDALTGLVNRAEMERRLQVALDSQATHAIHSLLYLDLDQFKVVNDTSGHAAGDALLKELGQLLKGQVRAQDTVARLGGDEFGVLLEACPSGPAVAIANKLRRVIADFPFSWSGHVFHVGVSIGHVSFASGEDTLSDVLSKADEACYVAKDLGRNRIHSYVPGDEEIARRHSEMELVGPIRKALKEERFVLYEQEIFHLTASEWPPHFEILLRMLSESGDLVPPNAFIPAAERFNLMPAIDRWVISKVLETLGHRIAADGSAVNGVYAINLSGGSVTDPHLSEFISEQLALRGVPGHCICFEITETAAIANLNQAVRLMSDLKKLGCQFSLDDFGSGMSSLAYLKRLPVNFLKIDGAFVRDLVTDQVDRALVSAIHKIAHVLGLKTIAEFVETDEILAHLRSIGIDYGQGYALSKPQPFT